MPDINEIADRIGSVGFRCSACGMCCSRVAEDSNLVIVSPAEIRAILAATGMAWDEVAEPYPDFIDVGEGGKLTFSWCIRRNRDACTFLQEGRCAIYPHRPWICRTYPFMLDGDDLIVSECPGLGTPLQPGEAMAIAQALLARQSAEAAEEAAVRAHYRAAVVLPKSRVVIDAEGVKVLDG
jgi:Fe-S-cluster containining protein